MNSVAFVTGGSRGIGLGCAEELAQNGFDLAINGIRDEGLVLPVIEKLKSYGTDVIYCQGDLGSAVARKEIIENVRSHYGRLNVLINNAGVAPKVRLDLLETTEESYDFVMNTNLKGAFFLSQEVARWMVDQKKENPSFEGCIINIGSISATVVSVNRSEYCVSKSGVAMMTQLFAARLGEFDIPVYEIRPGVTKTDMTSAVTEKYDQLIEEGLNVTKRWGYPEDVGRAAVLLAQRNFLHSTGQVLMIDGGLTLPRL